MTKKILILILVVGLILVSGLVLWGMEKNQKPELTKQELLQKFQILETQYKQAKTKGYDVSEVEKLGREAKRAFDKGDYKRTNELLKEAESVLKKIETAKTSSSTTTPETLRERLSQIKVASLFERITDYAAAGKSVEDVITELKETHTDFIFRGFWKWAPCPDSGGELGYDYQNLKKTITQIKREMPDLIFCGAIPAQRLTEGERNPKTGRLFTKEETKNMAFDSSKWNLPLSPEDIEKAMERQRLKGGYYPDLTNPDFQELLLSWAKKQIDAGADAIWIDGPFGAPSILVRTGRIEPDHPFVKEWLEAVSLIVDKIHEYGYSKYNKHIYVGTWVTFLDLPFPPPNLDFVTATPSGKEIESKSLDKQKWDKLEMRVRNKMGQNFPIFVFLDWSSRDDTPLAVFSQRLSTSEQNEMLKKMDKFFREREIIFVYPVHGGYMGNGATKLSYGKYKTYNSVYFGNYETIKELAQKKAGR